MSRSTSSSSVLTNDLARELRDKLLDEKRRRRAAQTERFHSYQNDPAGFVEDVLYGFLWSKQREICASLVANRFTAVKSCHGVGKTAGAARIGAWWLSVWPAGEALLVTTAPTGHQVKGLLWREINRVHAEGNLPGRTNLTEWYDDSGHLVGFGKSVRDTDPTSFQGYHARRILVILDEACGVTKAIWEAAETLVTNEDSRFLAIGNPDDPVTAFGEACRPGTGYNVIRISAFDSPNFTGETIPDFLKPLLVAPVWVEERRKKWGEESPMWKSKVTGDFPEVSSDGLIPLGDLHEATVRELPISDTPIIELGVDVARYGDDRSTFYLRVDDTARCVKRTSKQSTMQTVGHIVALWRKYGFTAAKIDDSGVGGGVVDRLEELKAEGQINFAIVPVNVGRAATTEKKAKEYKNLRAELNWEMRERFAAGRIQLLPPAKDAGADLEDLLAQAGAMKYTIKSTGHILIESKEDMKKRSLPSPDDWDGLVLSFASSEIGGRMAIETTEAAEFVVPPLSSIPRTWPRVCGIYCDRKRFAAVWGAHDRTAKRVYLYDEYVAPYGQLAVHARAVIERGSWIPSIFNLTAGERSRKEGIRIAQQLSDMRVDLLTVEQDDEEAVSEIVSRLSTKQLVVYETLAAWRKQQAHWRRDSDQELSDQDDQLMKATASLVLYGLDVAITENRAMSDEAGLGADEYSRGGNDVTGY